MTAGQVLLAARVVSSRPGRLPLRLPSGPELRDRLTLAAETMGARAEVFAADYGRAAELGLRSGCSGASSAAVTSLFDLLVRCLAAIDHLPAADSSTGS